MNCKSSTGIKLYLLGKALQLYCFLDDLNMQILYNSYKLLITLKQDKKICENQFTLFLIKK